MNQLDPVKLFARIANDIPVELHKNLIVTGSLAAAYEFRTRLAGQAVNTKDADLIIHPAGHVASCAQITKTLLGIGWSRTDQCFSQESREPLGHLRAIRMFPPESRDYFIEFLNVPAKGQTANKEWIPVQLSDGWYGLPSFRFMSVVVLTPRKSKEGVEYASVAMMALSNLLSHAELGDGRIESGSMHGILRSAKDLGRVLALAFLAGRDETESWIPQWIAAIQDCFPGFEQEMISTFGNGLDELIRDDSALADAFRTTDIGLLNRMSVSPDNLKAIGERLMVDLVEPVKNHFGQ